MTIAEGSLKRAGVIGWPVRQSLSPRLHGYWLQQYGVAGSYEAMGVQPQDLERFLRKLVAEGFAGVNLTLPHKEHALRLVDDADETAQRIGAVNTIVIRKGKLYGTNTDAYGFIENLRNAGLEFKGCRALVLGAGGASRAVCYGLLGQGVDVIVANRTSGKAQRLAQSQNGLILAIDWERAEAAMTDITLLVNTTSLGMQSADFFPLSIRNLPVTATVTDIVYHPLMTPLLKAAKARGNTVIDGLGMLLYQAQPGFEAWFGMRPEVTDRLRAYVMAGME